MLKKILEKSNFDTLHEELQKFYKLGDDQKYHLELEDDDAEPLRRAKEHEVGLRKIAEKSVETLTAELAATKEKLAEAESALSTDTVALRADHERAVAKLREQHTAEKAALEATIKKIFVSDKAASIAKEIAIDEGAAELLAEVMQRRLVVEMVNGEPVTRVLAADGTASNMSPDDLKTEYLQSKKYAGILRASEASGGGASGGGNGGGATGKKLADLDEAARNKMAKENPVEFRRLVAEAVSEADND